MPEMESMLEELARGEQEMVRTAVLAPAEESAPLRGSADVVGSAPELATEQQQKRRGLGPVRP